MNKVGERYVNKFGSWYTIIEYKNSRNVTIQFDDGTIVKNRRYDRINKGIAVSPYDKSINNICCIGEGKYKVWEDGKHTLEYGFYHNITTRCFNSNYKDIEKTYQDVTICEEWKNFQNFAKWVENNYYEVKNETMCIDKDILVKGNKIYSPETCIFVPKSINSLFVSGKTTRGDLPIGVALEKSTGKFKALCGNGHNKQIYLGCYNTPEEAFRVYKNYKERVIKQVADEYKPYIPKKLYDAMYRYEVEITD